MPDPVITADDDIVLQQMVQRPGVERGMARLELGQIIFSWGRQGNFWHAATSSLKTECPTP